MGIFKVSSLEQYQRGGNSSVPTEFQLYVFLKHKPSIFQAYCQNHYEKIFIAALCLAIKIFSSFSWSTKDGLGILTNAFHMHYKGLSKKQQRKGEELWIKVIWQGGGVYEEKKKKGTSQEDLFPKRFNNSFNFNYQFNYSSN